MSPTPTNSNPTLVAEEEKGLGEMLIALFVSFLGSFSANQSTEGIKELKTVDLLSALGKAQSEHLISDYNKQVNTLEMIRYLETELSKNPANPDIRAAVRISRDGLAGRYGVMAKLIERSIPTLDVRDPKAAEVARRVVAAIREEARQIRENPRWIPKEILPLQDARSLVGRNNENDPSVKNAHAILQRFGLDINNNVDRLAADYLLKKSTNQDADKFLAQLPNADEVMLRATEAVKFAERQISPTQGIAQNQYG
jgi:hypothetical protein